MDDLIAYIRGLLIADTTVISLFAAASPVVKSPGGESADEFPSILVTAADGPGMPQGEGGEMARAGTLTLTCVDRDDDDKLALETVWPLNNQIKFLIAGKENTATGRTVGGIVNTVLPGAPGVPATWQVVVCRTVEPSGPQNDPDPLIAKIRQTFKIMLMRV